MKETQKNCYDKVPNNAPFKTQLPPFLYNKLGKYVSCKILKASFMPKLEFF